MTMQVDETIEYVVILKNGEEELFDTYNDAKCFFDERDNKDVEQFYKKQRVLNGNNDWEEGDVEVYYNNVL